MLNESAKHNFNVGEQTIDDIHNLPVSLILIFSRHESKLNGFFTNNGRFRRQFPKIGEKS